MPRLTYLQRWSGTAGETTAGTPGHVLVVGPGGGASVLATDACDRAGLVLAPTTPAVRAELEAIGLGAGTSVANPLEIPFGPAAPVDALRSVLGPVLARESFPDVLVHVNVAAYYGYGTEGMRPLAAQLGNLAVVPIGDTRIAVVLRNLGVATPADAHLIAVRRRRLRSRHLRRSRRGRDRHRRHFPLRPRATRPRALEARSMTAHPFRDRAAIVGVGATPYSRDSGVSTLTLALRAITAVLADAGLTVADIDGVACHRVGDSAPASIVAESLGVPDLHYFSDQFGGGSTSHAVVGAAATAVVAGQAECVVCWRVVNACAQSSAWVAQDDRRPTSSSSSTRCRMATRPRRSNSRWSRANT